ncbi:hypothetical protein CIPAW_04G136800 [Carya illinoinensis]|uniref:WD repeat-containing protein 26-like n=1 Tax=Carya illinoinensis TaxID=32201 RepID=A0A8T1QU96_CARIL|nr:hypothetical protein CIPAW_04G136800 [Carya illinoinensis]
MGGVEDEEPATKRTKVSFEELRGLSNGSSFIEPVSASSSDLMARPLASEGDKEVVGSKGIIKRVEFVRIIANALYSLGYKKSCAHLEEESGIRLHSSVINVFMQQILDGNWDGSVSTLLKIGLSDERIVLSASLQILEQKFFELLDAEKVMDALKTLRTEIAPLCINKSRVRELSSCIIAPSQCNLVGSCSQDTVRSKSRSKLLLELRKLLSPTVMIPEDRLEHLVEQALLLQRNACIFHNSLDNEMSLYTDHLCGRDQIPSQTLQILQEHKDEVWFLQFSHNGKYLASSSNDRSAIIWEVDVNGGVSLKHRLFGHQKPVCAASWSPDDHELLTCGLEEVIRRWDVSSDGRELQCWKGQRTLRISDLEITNDGKQIISICRENAILLLNREANTERLIEEDQTVTTFSLSRDNRFLLVNLLDQEIHLWNIDGDLKLVAKYKGHKRTRFVIRSCFGGLAQAFIASGSEDSQVVHQPQIMRLQKEPLSSIIAYHSGPCLNPWLAHSS